MPKRATAEIFGKKVADRRNALFLSQNQLAIACKVSEVTIGRIESTDQPRVLLNKVPDYASGLRLSEDEFVANYVIALYYANGDIKYISAAPPVAPQPATTADPHLIPAEKIRTAVNEMSEEQAMKLVESLSMDLVRRHIPPTKSKLVADSYLKSAEEALEKVRAELSNQLEKIILREKEAQHVQQPKKGKGRDK